MANALKKISTEAKKIRKRHPGKSWKSAVKEASRRYNAGTIRPSRKKKHKATARKHKPRRVRKRHSVGAVHHTKKRSRKRSTRKRSTRREKTSHKKQHKSRKRGRRVGAVVQQQSKMDWTPILVVGALGLAAWALFKKSDNGGQPPVPAGAPPLAISTNPTRNSQASNIIAYATAAGMLLPAITKLIQSLNSKSDSEVNSIYNSVDSTGEIPGYLLA